MPVTAETLTLEQNLRAILAGVVDAQTRDLVRAWAVTWDELAPELNDTILDLIEQQAGRVVSKTTMRRSVRLQRALAVTAEALKTLASDAGVRITGDLAGIVAEAAAAQTRIIGSQLPWVPRIDFEQQRALDATLTAIVTRTTKQITAATRPLSREASSAMRRELIRAVVVGDNPRTTARRIIERTENHFTGGLTRALVISRTELLDAHRAGAAVGQAQHAGLLTGWRWLADLRPRTCRACLARHGMVFGLDVPGPEGHQQCILPGAVASGPRALASTTRWFDGEIVELQFGNGHSLTVTPNHPVLTAHGWVAAGLLREGDDVLGGSGADRPAAGRSPDDYQVPALIEDVAETLGRTFPVHSVRVPTAPEDFHGDGAGSQVHVVRTDRLLDLHRRPAVAQSAGQGALVVGDMGLSTLARGRHLDLGVQRLRDPSRGRMRGSDVAHVLLRGAGVHHEPVGGKSSARLHTCGPEAMLDQAPAHAVALRQGIDRSPREVSVHDLALIYGAASDHRVADALGPESGYLLTGPPQPPFDEHATEPKLAYPVPARDDLAAFAGEVVAHRVLHVLRRSWSGHVYNLQTETGWFLANGILTHNCRCARQPVTKSWADLGFDIGEPDDLVPDADEYFALLTAEQQQEILGAAGYREWKAGRWPREKWAVKRSTDGWRDSWVAAKPPRVP